MATPPIATFGRVAADTLTALHSTDGSPEQAAACLAQLEQLAAQMSQPYAARALIRALYRERAAQLRPQDARQPEGELERCVQAAAHAVWWLHRPAGQITDYLRAEASATFAAVSATMLPSHARELARALVESTRALIEAELVASVTTGAGRVAA